MRVEHVIQIPTYVFRKFLSGEDETSLQLNLKYPGIFGLHCFTTNSTYIM